MILPKTVQIVSEEKSYDDLGVLTGHVETILDTFQADIQPYSSKLAESQYGLSIKVTNRMFCEPNDNLNIGSMVKCNNTLYLVNSLMDFDRHFEVMLEVKPYEQI